MARLLRDLDYLRAIQQDNLLQVIEGNYQLLMDVEQASQDEMAGLLRQRYFMPSVFTDTKKFDITSVYNGNQLVEWSAPNYDITLTYITGSCVVQGTNIYKSIAGNTPGVFNPSQWLLVAVDKSLYYVKYPFAIYDPLTVYVPGNQVYFNNILYTNTQTTTGIVPNNLAYWSQGLAYTITGIYPDDTTKWTYGDNRNQEIVSRLIDIVLFHVHSRINPRNIPDLRKQNYNGDDPMDRGGAVGWLKAIASGDRSVNLPEISPEQGVSIMWGDAMGNGIGLNSYPPTGAQYYRHNGWYGSNNLW
jgi:hypothetical protein